MQDSLPALTWPIHLSLIHIFEVDEHHTIEDTALALGDCLYQALGSKRGIERYGYALPMDDCLCFSALEIPKEFQDIAVEFYDLILENDHPTALLGCRGNYDIAVQIDEVTGTRTGWHWFK